MATVLLTWELGAGIGHLMNLRPIGVELARRGHRVIAAVRELDRVRTIFAGTGINFMPAPVVPMRRKIFHPMRGLAHILGNASLADESVLGTYFQAWNTLFDVVEPDLVVADHSPNVLLALHGREASSGKRIPRVNVGLGFFCPPDGFPLPFWLKDSERHYEPQIVQDERSITAHVNAMLEAQSRPPLQRLSQFYAEADETILATYREFDHFGPRPEGSAPGAVRYWGHWPFAPGIAPRWPRVSGPKVYAYLKAFPTLEWVLELLQRTGYPTLLYTSGINRATIERFSGPTMHFEQRPVDLRAVAQQCDFGILNAGHGTAAAILLSGKPCLQLALYTEQLLFAQRVQKHNLGPNADVKNRAHIERALDDLFHNPIYKSSAQKFAASYATFHPGEQIPELVDRIEKLLPHPACT